MQKQRAATKPKQAERIVNKVCSVIKPLTKKLRGLRIMITKCNHTEEELCEDCKAKNRDTVNKSHFSGMLYGAVQWINDKPVLDGMPYFETKEACIEYAGRMGDRDTPPGISVRYTIIRLERDI